jgi:hypothetical protein
MRSGWLEFPTGSRRHDDHVRMGRIGCADRMEIPHPVRRRRILFILTGSWAD